MRNSGYSFITPPTRFLVLIVGVAVTAWLAPPAPDEFPGVGLPRADVPTLGRME